MEKKSLKERFGQYELTREETSQIQGGDFYFDGFGWQWTGSHDLGKGSFGDAGGDAPCPVLSGCIWQNNGKQVTGSHKAMQVRKGGVTHNYCCY